MIVRRPQPVGRPLRQRLLAAGSLVAYLLLVVGFPIPLAANQPNTTESGESSSGVVHPCGCSTEPGANCCCCGPGDPAEKQSPALPDQAPPSTGWIIGISALECQGQSTLWLSSGAVLPPPPLLDWQPSLDLLDCLAVVAELATGYADPLNTPPPRLS